MVDDNWWLPDYAAHGVRRDRQGNWTSVLFVPPRPSLANRFSRRRHSDVAGTPGRKDESVGRPEDLGVPSVVIPARANAVSRRINGDPL
jgi:hypothetical protein